MTNHTFSTMEEVNEFKASNKLEFGVWFVEVVKSNRRNGQFQTSFVVSWVSC
jgi:hypothetical protein